jgi:lipoprotein NlpD
MFPLLPVAFAILVVLLSACASQPPSRTPEPPAAARPSVHVVQSNETLYRIAMRYGLDWRELARRNGISPPYLIFPGQRLALSAAAPSISPRASQPPPRQSSAQSPTGSQPTQSSPGSRSPNPPAVPAVRPAPASATSSLVWQWPADGPVVRPFASSAVSRRGIGIAGERGDPVRAAAAGEVVYAGSGLVGYGRLIIIQHDARWISAYGHNDELLVTEGEKVRAGQRIARLGDSGTDRTILHFEIRVDGAPVDPSRYLPHR